MKTETKNCQNCKKDFMIEPEDFGFYEKMKVPAPETCPQCRQQLRMLFRNFKTLYKRPSSKSGKMIVSVYNSDVPFPVYGISEWWSDGWSSMSYGVDINWNQPFFSQLSKLLNTVPRVATMNSQTENCEYSNQITSSRNCYLSFGCLDDEDCDYSHIIWNCRDCIDNLYVFKCESCYECIDCLSCNKLIYSQECESCANSVGLFDCKGCFNCIGCVGLVNKSYCIFNKEVTKDEYLKFLKKNLTYDPLAIKNIIYQRDELRKNLPQRFFFGFRNNNVSGNHIYNSRNIHYSFDVKSGENSKFCFTVRQAVDSYDVSFTGDLSECYQVLTMLGSNKVIGSHQIVESHDVYYSDSCFNCDNIFGCVGLRKKSYCILNKQYTKEEYNKLFPKLIELMKKNDEWGLFFPKELSPFGYNESIVNEYMPLQKEEALVQGYRWQDNIPFTVKQETIKLQDLPLNSLDYTDNLKSEVLACESCNKNYRLISREIAFYKKMGLSVPHKCFNCRHENRMKKRNSRTLLSAKCAKCGLDIKTSYKKEDQEKYMIYCERCYQQEVY